MMPKPKAKESYIVRTTEAIASVIHDEIIPKGTRGVVVEVYQIGDRYLYATDLFASDAQEENLVLKEDQFEVLEEHDMPMSGHPEPWIWPSPDSYKNEERRPDKNDKE
jgi:hypothetical protein